MSARDVMEGRTFITQNNLGAYALEYYQNSVHCDYIKADRPILLISVKGKS